MDRAIREQVGVVEFEADMSGQVAPVGVSHLGVNPAEMLSRFLLELKTYVHCLNESRVNPWTQYPSPYQIVIQELKSEFTLRTTPQKAHAYSHMTFPPPRTLSQMKDMIKEQAATFSAAHSLENAVEIRWAGYQAEPKSSGAERLEHLLELARRRCKFDPITIGPSTGTSDMHHFDRLGIPVLMYGPGQGYNPHRPNEYYHVDDLSRMSKFLLQFLDLWWSGSP